MIYGIGVDLIRVERIARAVDRHGERFLGRVFTDREIAHCQRRVGRASCLAMRFAAKEAFSKALGVGLRRGGIRWQDVEVIPDAMGKPELVITGRAAQLCEAAGIRGMHLTLTDEDPHALAVVILEK